MLNAAGQNEESTGLIRCFPEGLLCFFDLSCFTSFSKVFIAGFNKVFIAGFSIMCPVHFREVDLGSLRPINRGLFSVDNDEDGQMITGQ